MTITLTPNQLVTLHALLLNATDDPRCTKKQLLKAESLFLHIFTEG